MGVLLQAWLVILAPLLLALLVLLPVPGHAWRGRVALLGPLAVGVLGIGLWHVSAGDTVTLLPGSWFSVLGASPALRVDRLGAFFVMLIGWVGVGVYQYAGRYLGDRATPSFWALMLAFTAAMLGVVLAENLIVLYVFWELTTVTSALLIAQGGGKSETRQSAVHAFLMTGAGGLLLLAGIVLLGERAGSYEWTVLIERAPALMADPAHQWPLLLILLGAFAKSAQVPFHSWLPAAMTAPAPVSAYLHSATMVKAGVFLIARSFHVFSESPLWLPLLATVGLTSFLVAGWNALWSDDIKKLLAYSTIAYLGLLVAHYGYSARIGLRGELLMIGNHALYKSALFLLVGWAEKATGTRDLRILSRESWPRREPIGMALLGLGALALAGSPLLLGFVGKELFLGAFTGEDDRGVAPAILVVVAATGLGVAYALKIFAAVLFGSEHPPEGRGLHRRHISAWLLIVPALLLLPQVLGGLAPALLLQPIVEPDLNIPPGPAVWHRADRLLGMSLVSFAVGGALFMAWRRWRRARHHAVAEQVSQLLASGVLRLASFTGRGLQAGGLPRFGSIITASVLVAVLALGWPAQLGAPALIGDGAPLAWATAAVTIAAAVLVPLVRARLTMAVALGIVGYGVAFLYAQFRAPDLVLTQVLVETLTLVLLVLAFRRMPEPAPEPPASPRRLGHLGLALAAGATMTVLAWTAAEQGAPERSGHAQLALSEPVAHGHNVVNVILVDFRGADTLGEIVVLAIAALGVLALRRPLRAGR